MTLGRSLALACAACILVAPDVVAEPRSQALSASIEPQPLAKALAEFAAQTGLQIIYLSELAVGQDSLGAPHGLSVDQALERLLAGTGLQFEFLTDQTLRIFLPSRSLPGQTPPAATSATRVSRFSERPLVPLEEVVVNADRRLEPIGNLPVSSIVWTREAMEVSGVKSMSEIGPLTPGIEFDFNSRLGDYYTNLAIRGVTDMHGNTTTVFLDDTPLLPGRGDTFLRMFPLTFDLDRVEVLRGPQGGRFGYDVLGGIVRFVTTEPSLTNFTAFLRSELATTERGDPSLEVGAAIGGPIATDLLGARISAWYRSDGGFVDRVDPASGEILDRNANHSTSKSTRFALAWAPTDAVRVEPSIDYQSVGGHDVSTFYVDLSDPEQGQLKNGTPTRQPFDDTSYLASLRLSLLLDQVEFTSVNSYLERSADIAIDQSFGDLSTPITGDSDLREYAFTHETRLISDRPDAKLSWTAGITYSSMHIRETSGTNQQIENTESETITDQTTFSAFGEVSWHLSDRLSVNAGVRTGRAEYDSVSLLPTHDRVRDVERFTTPDLGLTYHADADSQVYLTVAKGFRSGGVYAPFFGCAEIPLPFASDSLWNYELGTKQSGLLNHRLDLDASAFHITWSNPQESPMSGCNSNSYRTTSAAASDGFNLTTRWFLGEHWRAGLAISYTDARYTRTVKVDEQIVVQKGDALGSPPFVTSPWNVTASFEANLAVTRGHPTSLRAEYVYHSENPGPFHSRHPASPYYSPDRGPDPATSVINVRALISFARIDAALFINNLLDSQPTLSRTNVCCEDPVFTAVTFRPRTVGASLTWRL